MLNRKKQDIDKTKKVLVKPINYPPKILIAWAKAIEGNKDILQWLSQNGYPELAMATYAIYLKDEARNWLTENGYPHLLAMINGAERDEKAKLWLKQFGFDLLFHMAEAIDDSNESIKWLKLHATADIMMVTQAIKTIKDQIEDNHNNIHYFGKDF